jgi:hypothetical protein
MRLIIKIWPIILLCYGLLHYTVMPLPWANDSLTDTGIFSILTISLQTFSLFLMVLTALRMNQRYLKYLLFALSFILLIYVLREADCHRLFTDGRVTEFEFYTDNTVDLTQKLIGGTVMLTFILTVIVLSLLYGKFVIKHIIQKKPWAITLIFWFVSLFLSQVADKTDLNHLYWGQIVEELLELCAAGYMLIAVYFARQDLLKFVRQEYGEPIK